MATDDPLIGEMIKAVRELGERIVTLEKRLTERIGASERKAESERKKLREEVNATIVALREDFNDVTMSIQLRASQHTDEHLTERQERAADAVERTNRQAVWNLWMGGLTVLVLVNLILLGILVVQQAAR